MFPQTSFMLLPSSSSASLEKSDSPSDDLNTVQHIFEASATGSAKFTVNDFTFGFASRYLTTSSASLISLSFPKSRISLVFGFVVTIEALLILGLLTVKMFLFRKLAIFCASVYFIFMALTCATFRLRF